MPNSRTDVDGRFAELSDRGLLHFFAVHLDQAAFTEIVRRYQHLVMNVCRRTTGNPEDAEDAFQATFIALARRPRQLRRAKCLSSWLYSVAWRTSIRANRFRRKHTMQPVPETLPADTPDPLLSIAEARERTVLDEELNSLPEHYRSVLVMNYLAGRTTREIAQDEQTTKGVIDGRLKRAKNALRVRLIRRGVSLAVLATAGTQMTESASAQLIQSTLNSGLPQTAGRSPQSTDACINRLAGPETGISFPLIPTFAVSIVMFVGFVGWHYMGSEVVAADDTHVSLKSSAVVQDRSNVDVSDTAGDDVVVTVNGDQKPGNDSSDDESAAVAEPMFRGVPEADLLNASGEWGGVSGHIVLDGTVPERKLLFPAGAKIKNAAVCAAVNTFDNTLIVDPTSKGIANCFVYLPKAPPSIHPLLVSPIRPAVVQDQKGCQYTPHALLVQTGQTVRCISSDPVAHNVHTYPFRNVGGNFVVAPKGKKGMIWTPTAHELLPIQVKCDFHPWMVAYWLIQNHPYAAITDSQGRFRIAGLSAGEHKLRIWHERIGYIDREFKVTVADGEINEQPVIRVAASRFDSE